MYLLCIEATKTFGETLTWNTLNFSRPGTFESLSSSSWCNEAYGRAALLVTDDGATAGCGIPLNNPRVIHGLSVILSTPTQNAGLMHNPVDNSGEGMKLQINRGHL